LFKVLITASQPVPNTRAHVLHQYVGCFQQLMQSTSALFAFQVEYDGALVAVKGSKVKTHTVFEGRRPASQIPFWTLYLDDVCPKG